MRLRDAEDGTCLAVFTESVTSRVTCIVFSPGAELSVASLITSPTTFIACRVLVEFGRFTPIAPVVACSISRPVLSKECPYVLLGH